MSRYPLFSGITNTDVTVILKTIKLLLSEKYKARFTSSLNRVELVQQLQWSLQAVMAEKTQVKMED